MSAKKSTVLYSCVLYFSIHLQKKIVSKKCTILLKTTQLFGEITEPFLRQIKVCICSQFERIYRTTHRERKLESRERWRLILGFGLYLEFVGNNKKIDYEQLYPS